MFRDGGVVRPRHFSGLHFFRIHYTKKINLQTTDPLVCCSTANIVPFPMGGGCWGGSASKLTKKPFKWMLMWFQPNDNNLYFWSGAFSLFFSRSKCWKVAGLARKEKFVPVENGTWKESDEKFGGERGMDFPQRQSKVGVGAKRGLFLEKHQNVSLWAEKKENGSRWTLAENDNERSACLTSVIQFMKMNIAAVVVRFRLGNELEMGINWWLILGRQMNTYLSSNGTPWADLDWAKFVGDWWKFLIRIRWVDILYNDHSL